MVGNGHRCSGAVSILPNQCYVIAFSDYPKTELLKGGYNFSDRCICREFCHYTAI